MPLIEVTEKEQLEDMMSKQPTKLFILYFWAHWCQPCNIIGPSFTSMSHLFPLVEFIRINVDDAGDLADEFNIGYAPSFIFLKSNQKLATYHGIDEFELRAMVEKYSK